MQYAEVTRGRTFVLRLEHAEVIHEVIEQFAKENGVVAASVTALGGVDTDSALVVGPEDGKARPVNPQSHALADVHEVCGIGTIFPDDTQQPVLHMHMSCGRDDSTVTGCIRSGVVVWQILEVIVQELTGVTARRMPDNAIGFKLLQL